MNGATVPNPKLLLSVTGAAEAATGLALAAAPAMLTEWLLGAAPGTAAGVTLGRVAGVAILALGVVCWLARDDAADRTATGLIAVMLLYNVGVVAILVLAWTGQGLSGIVLWPVVLAHTALAFWCALALSAGSKEKRS